MAFTNEKLSDVVQVTSGGLNSIVTVSSLLRKFISGTQLIINELNGQAATAYVYVVPNGSSAATINKMFNIDLNVQEIYCSIEPFIQLF